MDETRNPKLTMAMLVGFYSTCVKHLARRVSEDGRRDFMLGLAIAACTGVAAFVLRDRDWLKALVVAIGGLVLWLWAVAIVHFAKVPVAIHLNPETEAKAKSESSKLGLAGTVILLFLIVVPASATWWWCSGHSLENEPETSLRRATIGLANDVDHYVRTRWDNHPARLCEGASIPNPTEEQRKAFDECRKYDEESFKFINDHFKADWIAIVKQYEAKGVKVGYLANDMEQNQPAQYTLFPFPPEIDNGMYTSPISRFRELAYHVNERNERVEIKPPH